MKNLVVVGRGHVGRHLAEVLETDRIDTDMDQIDDQMIEGRIVVCAAGKTDLPWCEAHPLKAWEANVAAPYELAQRVLDLGGKYIHLSSGCVWDGPYLDEEGKEPFQPLDPVSPACFYSWTKAACDALLWQLVETQGPLTILRPRQVYSPHRSPRNLLQKLLGYEKLLDTANSMTSVDTIAKTIKILVEDERSPLWGETVNVYDKGVASPFIAGGLLAAAGLRKEPAKLEKSDLDSWHKPKRVDTVLFDLVFEEEVDPPVLLDELSRVIKLFASR